MAAQQNWTELLSRPTEVQHRCQPFLADIQWPASGAGEGGRTVGQMDSVIRQDLALLLECLPGLEKSGMERRHAVCR